MKFEHIHHIAIIASNIDVSKKFYSQILGFKIIRETYRKKRDSWKIDLQVNPTTQIELFSFPGAPKRPSQPEAIGLRHLAFEVEFLDEAITYLTSNNIEVEPIRVDETTKRRFTFFTDPDGLPLELYEKDKEAKVEAKRIVFKTHDLGKPLDNLKRADYYSKP